MSAQNLTSILLRNPQLRQLCSQSQLLGLAQARLEEALPAELVPHCQVAAIQAGSLTLHTDSPAWAARLRYLGPDILHALQADSELPTIRAVRIRTIPQNTPAIRKKPRPGLSTQTVQLLRDVAESIQDPETARRVVAALQ
jgi:hypothetical protein